MRLNETEGQWEHPPMVSKMRGIRLKQGQSVRLETPGGGGYGSPSSRAPAVVADDVRRELITADHADEQYGRDWRAVTS